MRQLLGAEEGDDLLFYTDEIGQVIVSRAQIITPDQAWFWSQCWQQLEREVQGDVQAGQVLEFSDVQAALAALDQLDDASDAED